jgi:hypothetical protein
MSGRHRAVPVLMAIVGFERWLPANLKPFSMEASLMAKVLLREAASDAGRGTEWLVLVAWSQVVPLQVPSDHVLSVATRLLAASGVRPNDAVWNRWMRSLDLATRTRGSIATLPVAGKDDGPIALAMRVLVALVAHEEGTCKPNACPFGIRREQFEGVLSRCERWLSDLNDGRFTLVSPMKIPWGDAADRAILRDVGAWCSGAGADEAPPIEILRAAWILLAKFGFREGTPRWNEVMVQLRASMRGAN